VAVELFRSGLLEGQAIVLAAGAGAYGDAAADACAELGASVQLLDGASACSPPPGAGEHAEATRAALENLARTTSIEWARYAIRPTAIAPGDGTSAEEVASLVAFLASPAGDYCSGCLFSLGEVAPA
jgi:hypothetical protein